MDDEARARITRARSQLVLKSPFFGYLCLHMKPQEDNNMHMPTMGTDGRHLFYDTEYVKGLQTEQLRAVICHEVMHCALGHLWRIGAREHDRWNIATDAVINYIIRKQGFILPPGIISIPEAENLSAEELYNRIKDMEGIQGEVLDDHGKWGKSISDDAGGEKGGSEDETEGGDGGDNNGSDKKDDDGSEGNSGSDSDKDGEGNKEGDNSDSGSKDASKQLQDIAKSLARAKNINKQLEHEWKKHVSRARQLAKMQGFKMGDLEELVNDLLEPKLNWKELLRNFLLSSTKSNYRLMPPNKRHLWRGIYLPSSYGEKVDIAYAVDTSGSMSIDEIREALSELKGVCRQFDDWKINFFQCDAAVQEMKEMTPYDCELPKKAKGRGGTDFCPVFNDIYKRNLDITCLVYFTDGYGTVPNNRPNYPVLWLITKNGSTEGDSHWKAMGHVGRVMKIME